MITRRVVLILGALIALMGVSQILAASWWLRIMPSIMDVKDLRIFGIVALAMGIILTYAAVKRLVGLRIFVLVLGILMLVGGTVLLVNPVMLRDNVYASILSRPYSSQLMFAWLGGAFRTLIGLALILAVTKAGTYTGSHHAHA